MKPPVLGSSSVTFMIASQKLPWMERNAGKTPLVQFKLGLNGETGTKLLILAKPRGSGGSQDGIPTGNSPWVVWEMVPLAKQLSLS